LHFILLLSVGKFSVDVQLFAPNVSSVVKTFESLRHSVAAGWTTGVQFPTGVMMGFSPFVVASIPVSCPMGTEGKAAGALS
jgi:hypothetical protein